jgi:glycosyltransferase involved in cell wall biosynthesis
MLTVIVPNYNHSQWLPISLQAIIQQVPPPDELIVIDDGSTDDSVSIAKSILEHVPYARVECNPHNMGCMATQNRALDLAKGDLIFFTAADDMILPGFIAESLSLLRQYPQAALCSTLSISLDEQGNNHGLIQTPQPDHLDGYVSCQQAANSLMWDDSWFMGNTVIYRRDILRQLGGFQPQLGAMADGFMCRLLALTYGCCFIAKPLAAWRQLAGGMAWSVSADWRKTRHLCQQAALLMAGPHKAVFPPGYARRWQGRALFGAINFLWRLKRQNAQQFPLKKLGLSILSLLVVGTAFVLLRPQDSLAVLRRRLGY